MTYFGSEAAEELPWENNYKSYRLKGSLLGRSARLSSFLICFTGRLNRSNLERNLCVNIKICKSLISNQTNISNFHPLEVVARGSETQL